MIIIGEGTGQIGNDLLARSVFGNEFGLLEYGGSGLGRLVWRVAVPAHHVAHKSAQKSVDGLFDVAVDAGVVGHGGDQVLGALVQSGVVERLDGVVVDI